MRTGVIVAIAALAFSLMPTVAVVDAKSAPQPPHNAGSSSPLVRYGYFTSVDHFPTELRRVTDFPAAIKEFDAAKDFLDALDDVQGTTMVSALFPTIQRKVELNADQRPLYSPIKSADHQDGDFIFVRTSPETSSPGTKDSP